MHEKRCHVSGFLSLLGEEAGGEVACHSFRLPSESVTIECGRNRVQH